MTDRPSRAACSILTSALLGMLSLLGGCPRPEAASIGNPCTVTAAPGTGAAASEVTVSSPALECAGRVCLQVGSTSPLCTAACGSDDDCIDLASSASDQCHLGFVCRAVSPFGAHPCQHLCVCKDAPPVAAGCDGTP